MNRRLTIGVVLPLAVGMIAVAGAMHTPTSHTFAAAATAPPPPTYVATTIPPPPGPPTNTPTITPIPTNTPVPTATATPSPTSAPLGAQARLVGKSSLRHEGRYALVRWHMVYQLGIKGFRIFAGHKLLTRTLIHPHHSPNYSARVSWVKGGKYILQVRFKNGHARKFSVR